MATEVRENRLLYLGRLNDRPVTHWFSDKAMLVLCPMVYLRIDTSDLDLELDTSEIAEAFFVPMNLLLQHLAHPDLLRAYPISLPVLSRSGLIRSWPQDKWLWLKELLQRWTGNVYFPTISICQSGVPLEPWMSAYKADELRIWGLTLRMTSDVLDLCFRSPRWKGLDLSSLECTHVQLDYADMNWMLSWVHRRSNSIGTRSDGHRTWDKFIPSVALTAFTWRSIAFYLLVQKIRARL
jgi:hypothetical protein